MYIVTHKFTQHVKKNQFFFLRGIILPLSPLRRAAARVAPLSAQPAPDDIHFWTLSAQQ
jgi:hypothetical protein